MALLLDHYKDSVLVEPGSGANIISYPSEALPGDLVVLTALGRSLNFATPSGWTAFWTTSGSTENAFTTPLVCWRFVPDPVPSPINLGSPTWNSASAMVALNRSALLPGVLPNSAERQWQNATIASTVDPGSITVSRPCRIICCVAANSGSNVEEVVYTPGAWRSISPSSSGDNRITVQMFDIEIPAGATDLPAITMNRSEYRAYMLWPIYNIDERSGSDAAVSY